MEVDTQDNTQVDTDDKILSYCEAAGNHIQPLV